jgi:hypothetical protein
MLVVVLKLCVTETKVTRCASIVCTSLAKSISERDRRSILWTPMTSTSPASMSARRRFSAGRSRLPPD